MAKSIRDVLNLHSHTLPWLPWPSKTPPTVNMSLLCWFTIKKCSRCNLPTVPKKITICISLSFLNHLAFNLPSCWLIATLHNHSLHYFDKRFLKTSASEKRNIVKVDYALSVLRLNVERIQSCLYLNKQGSRTNSSHFHERKFSVYRPAEITPKSIYYYYFLFCADDLWQILGWFVAKQAHVSFINLDLWKRSRMLTKRHQLPQWFHRLGRWVHSGGQLAMTAAHCILSRHKTLLMQRRRRFGVLFRAN